MTYTEEWVTTRARDAYERGQASFGVRPERTALLVIDMQNEFVQPGWSPYWVPAAPGWRHGCNIWPKTVGTPRYR